MANVFSSYYMGSGTWVIRGPGCDCYLLLGDDEAVMIDAGWAPAPHNIRAYAQGLTALPLRRVVNTHGHFDHTGGNGYFDEVLATARCAAGAKNTMGAPPSHYPLSYSFTLIQDGGIIPLAGRPLRVLELNCHSPGDIVLLDESRRLLFCGDEVESGQSLLLPGFAEKPGQVHSRPAATVEACLAAMQRMKAEQAHFDLLCPSHNGTPLSPVYLDWYIALCGEILQGTQQNAPLASESYNQTLDHFPYENAGYLRAVHKGAGLIYNSRLIRQADAANAAALPAATPLHMIASQCI